MKTADELIEECTMKKKKTNILSEPTKTEKTIARIIGYTGFGLLALVIFSFFIWLITLLWKLII